MKRVQVSPGKFVTVSTAVAEKAAKAFASGAFTPAQVRKMMATEPMSSSGLLIGGPGKSKTFGRRIDCVQV